MIPNVCSRGTCSVGRKKKKKNRTKKRNEGGKEAKVDPKGGGQPHDHEGNSPTRNPNPVTLP